MALTKQILKDEIKTAFQEAQKAALEGNTNAQDILVEKLAQGFVNALVELDHTNMLIVGVNQGGPLKVESVTVKIL